MRHLSSAVAGTALAGMAAAVAGAHVTLTDRDDAEVSQTFMWAAQWALSSLLGGS